MDGTTIVGGLVALIVSALISKLSERPLGLSLGITVPVWLLLSWESLTGNRLGPLAIGAMLAIAWVCGITGLVLWVRDRNKPPVTGPLVIECDERDIEWSKRNERAVVRFRVRNNSPTKSLISVTLRTHSIEPIGETPPLTDDERGIIGLPVRFRGEVENINVASMRESVTLHPGDEAAFEGFTLGSREHFFFYHTRKRFLWHSEHQGDVHQLLPWAVRSGSYRIVMSAAANDVKPASIEFLATGGAGTVTLEWLGRKLERTDQPSEPPPPP